MLDIKAKEEQLKKIELLRLTQKLTERRSELLMRKRILSELISDLAGQEPKKRLSEQELFLKHSTRADEFIKRLEEQVNRLESEQRAKIAELIKLRRFKEGLDKLRAEAKAKFIEEQEKLEQKELDEMAAIRFARQSEALSDMLGRREKVH